MEAVLKLRATTRGEREVGDKNAAFAKAAPLGLVVCFCFPQTHAKRSSCQLACARLRRNVRELENDASGEGRRRLEARRRRALASQDGASRVESAAQAAVRARCEQDAAAFAVDFEDTRCVVRQRPQPQAAICRIPDGVLRLVEDSCRGE